MEKRIIIIDGNSLINRAYYAMQRPMITKEGVYTQGVYGFINMLEKIKKEHPSGYIMVAFDKKAPTFRHKEYKEYKAGRKKMPPELAMQIPLLKEILSAMKIKMLEKEGFEADDIIGTVAKKAEEQGLFPLIITGDKDELQLASDITKVMITKKGISQFKIYDADAMKEEYGFTPLQFIDFKGLMGDQSDNIPGLPGVGEKTAKKLIYEYGSVENLLKNAEGMQPGKLRDNIEDNAQLAVMSKRLASINTEMPLDMDFDEYKWQEAEKEKLISIYVKLEFNSFLKRMEGKTGPHEQLQEDNREKKYKGETDIETAEEIVISSREDMDMLDEYLGNSKKAVLKVFSNNDHKNPPEITGTAMLVDDKYFYANQSFVEKTAQLLKKNEVMIIGHDLKKDHYALMFQKTDRIKTGFDTCLAQYVLDPGRSNYDLKVLAQEYLNMEMKDEKTFMIERSQIDIFDDSSTEFSEYGKSWCWAVQKIMEEQKKRLIEENLEKVFYDVEMPLIEVMAFMEYAGFMLDKSELSEIGKDVTERIEKLKELIYLQTEEEFNINSTQQLGKIIFEKLGLPSGKKTKTGYSTDAEVLERLKDKHTVIPLLLEYRMLTKLKGTYIDGLLPLAAWDGRIHAHFLQTVAATGRISCIEPNLQNIPIRQEIGRKIRKAFVPSSDEYILIAADYSQIELRVLAHMSGDAGLIDAFNEGEDIHRTTASRVLGIPEEEINIEQRSRAKAVNFGVIYGMSAFGLSSELKISRKEAEKYINDYFLKHKAVKSFMDSQVSKARENGWVKTIMGRKRYIKEINVSNYTVRQIGERLAMNSPIQGSAADIIKLAMVKVHDALKKGGYRSRLILQVHDELIVEAPKEEQEEVSKLLKENMESAMELKVPLFAELNAGKNWYELK
jgi:DNA polymerase-1